MADRVRSSHVVATDDTIMPMQSKDKVANARMCVCAKTDSRHRGRKAAELWAGITTLIFKTDLLLISNCTIFSKQWCGS
jgi:hypothetical protein